MRRCGRGGVKSEYEKHLHLEEFLCACLQFALSTESQTIPKGFSSLSLLFSFFILFLAKVQPPLDTTVWAYSAGGKETLGLIQGPPAVL